MGKRTGAAIGSTFWRAMFLVVVEVSTGCRAGKTRTDEAVPRSPQIFGAGGLTPQAAARPIIKVGDATLTLGRFAERLQSQAPVLAARYAEKTGPRAFLDEMVHFELLAAEAQRRGFDENADAERAAREAAVERMMRDLFERRGPKLSDVTDAEIRKYYDAHRDEFDQRLLEQVRPLIQNRLWLAKRDAAIEAFLTELRKKAAVHERPELLAGARIDLGSRPAK